MNSANNPNAVIDMLAKNEEAMEALYELYAEKFPERSDFWTELAEEEAEHAFWIRSLASKVGEGTLRINQKRFSVSAIQTFSDYLDKEVVTAKTSWVPLVNALSVALYVEESIIEQRFFEVFEGDSPELRQTLLDLAAATKKHRTKVKEALGKGKAL